MTEKRCDRCIHTYTSGFDDNDLEDVPMIRCEKMHHYWFDNDNTEDKNNYEYWYEKYKKDYHVTNFRGCMTAMYPNGYCDNFEESDCKHRTNMCFNCVHRVYSENQEEIHCSVNDNKKVKWSDECPKFLMFNTIPIIPNYDEKELKERNKEISGIVKILVDIITTINNSTLKSKRKY